MNSDKPTAFLSLPRIASLSDAAVNSELSDLLDEAGPVERRILLYMSRRLVALGQRTYGKLDLEKDQRDMVADLTEEVSDATVYGSVALLKRGAL